MAWTEITQASDNWTQVTAEGGFVAYDDSTIPYDSDSVQYEGFWFTITGATDTWTEI